MIYLLKDDNYYALVSDTGEADGWHLSIEQFNLSLPHRYYHADTDNVLKAIEFFKHTILSTYTDIDHFKFKHPELFI